MRKPRAFEILYSSTFTILSVVLSVLLLITPGDAIRQALDPPRQLYIVFIIAAVYLLTLVLAILVYASRLYSNRTVLDSIPKTWLPIERSDVGKRVARLIASGLSRSILIANESAPRDLSATPLSTADPKSNPKLRRAPTKDVHPLIPINPAHPPWGHICHPGWSPPSSPDLPNLEYHTVIIELPHLIEAKVIALCPNSPIPTPTPPAPDPRILALLQRPSSMTLRAYLSHLASLSLIPSPSSHSTIAFLSQYESARFSDTQPTEPDFRTLMTSFADVLRSVQPLSPDVLADFLSSPSRPSSSSTSPHTATDDDDRSSTTTSDSTIDHPTAAKLPTPALSPPAGATAHDPTPSPLSRTLTPTSTHRSTQQRSLSAQSSIAGSVIRLALPDDHVGTGLPYTIRIQDTGGIVQRP